MHIESILSENDRFYARQVCVRFRSGSAEFLLETTGDRVFINEDLLELRTVVDIRDENLRVYVSRDALHEYKEASQEEIEALLNSAAGR